MLYVFIILFKIGNKGDTLSRIILFSNQYNLSEIANFKALSGIANIKKAWLR
jgi:hypothetical protein